MNYSAFHWAEKARKYAETVGTIFNVKGRVNTVQELPSTGNKVGDLWLVGLTTDPDLIEYAWLSFDNVTRWEKLGSTATSLAFSGITGNPYDNTSLATELNGKQATISDLAAIRSGASAGATALQPSALNGYATESWVNNKGYLTGITSAMVTTALGYTPQQQLVSGTNIKTINGNSLLGSGNLALCSFKLFHHDWFDYQLNDQDWLRADTFSWQNGTVYTNAYNHLVADYNGGTSQTETVGSYTITYVLATDGHKITTDETTVNNIYNESGVSWYYILDTTNQRFKLPRTKYGFTGLRDTVGKYVEAGLPDHKHVASTGGVNFGSSWTSGSILINSTSYGTAKDTNNASVDNPIYGNSTTVQPPATQMYLYFYVGQFSQSAIEQTAGLNSELFNSKMDRDMSNMNASQTAKETIVGWGMPDYSAGISLTNGQVYTPSVNGIFIVSASGTWAVAAVYLGTSADGVELGINRSNSSDNNGRAGVTVLANAGETYYIRATPTAIATFYPLKGVQNA